MTVNKVDRISSGIPGFDQMLKGGFEKGSNIIVSGTPGTGKSTFAMQFVVDGAKKGERCLYLSMSESINSIVSHSSQFWEEIQELMDKKLIKMASYPHEFTQQLGEAGAKVSRLVDQLEFLMGKTKVDRLVIDSISLLAYRYVSPQAQRIELDQLFQYLAKKGITTYFVLERNSWNNVFTFEDFLADAVVILQDIVEGFDRKRGLNVIKMRGSEIDRAVRPFSFTKSGLVVYPDSQII